MTKFQVVKRDPDDVKIKWRKEVVEADNFFITSNGGLCFTVDPEYSNSVDVPCSAIAAGYWWAVDVMKEEKEDE